MTRAGRGPRSRRGFAIGLVVILTLALALLAHAALLLARTEVWITRIEGRRLEAWTRAGAALARYHADADSLPTPGSGTTPFGAVRASRLSPEVAILTAHAGYGGGTSPVPVGRARLLYAPDPLVRVAQRTAGIQGGEGLFLEGSARVGSAQGGAGCDASIPALPDFRRREFTEYTPLLGILSFRDLTDRVPAPGGWRDASGSWILGDTLAGAWALEGPAVVAENAVVRGWLWVLGDLRVQAGAVVEGLLDVSGRVEVASGASILVSPCAAAGAASRAPGLRSPWRVGPEAWPLQ